MNSDDPASRMAGPKCRSATTGAARIAMRYPSATAADRGQDHRGLRLEQVMPRLGRAGLEAASRKSAIHRPVHAPQREARPSPRDDQGPQDARRDREHQQPAQDRADRTQDHHDRGKSRYRAGMVTRRGEPTWMRPRRVPPSADWQEDDLLRELREDLEARGPAIRVSPETGRLLAICRGLGARRVLEVGTLFGYSGVWIARALPSDGSLDTLELSDVHADAAEEWFARAGVADRVTVRRGARAHHAPPARGPYDMVFLDAAKAEYVDYAEQAARLLRAGGSPLADNAIWSGRIADPAVRAHRGIRRFHELIAEDRAWDSTVLPVGVGVAVP